MTKWEVCVSECVQEKMESKGGPKRRENEGKMKRNQLS